jgi:hypothetical protein
MTKDFNFSANDQSGVLNLNTEHWVYQERVDLIWTQTNLNCHILYISTVLHRTRMIGPELSPSLHFQLRFHTKRTNTNSHNVQIFPKSIDYSAAWPPALACLLGSFSVSATPTNSQSVSISQSTNLMWELYSFRAKRMVTRVCFKV